MRKDTDAIVIGAGIIGCCTAFELAKKGYRTLNIDKLPGAGHGSTGNSCAIIRVYIANGDRTNRKRARLKYVLEKMPLAEYLTETETLLGYSLTRAPQNAGTGLSEFEKAHELPNTPHPQVGVFPQKQVGLSYVGVALPVGQITPEQMLRIADLAD